MTPWLAGAARPQQQHHQQQRSPRAPELHRRPDGDGGQQPQRRPGGVRSADLSMPPVWRRPRSSQRAAGGRTHNQLIISVRRERPAPALAANRIPLKKNSAQTKLRRRAREFGASKVNAASVPVATTEMRLPIAGDRLNKSAERRLIETQIRTKRARTLRLRTARTQGAHPARSWAGTA